jgi:hypothetical protein
MPCASRKLFMKLFLFFLPALLIVIVTCNGMQSLKKQTPITISTYESLSITHITVTHVQSSQFSSQKEYEIALSLAQISKINTLLLKEKKRRDSLSTSLNEPISIQQEVPLLPQKANKKKCCFCLIC